MTFSPKRLIYIIKVTYVKNKIKSKDNKRKYNGHLLFLLSLQAHSRR